MHHRACSIMPYGPGPDRSIDIACARARARVFKLDLVIFMPIHHYSTMERRELFLGVLAVAACAVSVYGSLKIAAFNVESFGQAKLSRPDVVAVLTKVCSYFYLLFCLFSSYCNGALLPMSAVFSTAPAPQMRRNSHAGCTCFLFITLRYQFAK